MDKKNNLLEKSLDLFSLNKIDRDIYTWTGKMLVGQEYLVARLWLRL